MQLVEHRDAINHRSRIVWVFSRRMKAGGVLFWNRNNAVTRYRRLKPKGVQAIFLNTHEAQVFATSHL